MVEMRNAYKISVCKAEGNRKLEDQGVNGRIILKWILNIILGFQYHLVIFGGEFS
jgi:hypothetical protein